MKQKIGKLTNFSFGSTSAIITNMSLIIGLGSTDMPKSTIISGLLVIGIADNISDSLGIHIYKESESGDARGFFLSTVTNFIARLCVSLVFVAIVLLLPIPTAQLISIIWGLSLLIILSYFISKGTKKRPLLEILKHIVIAIIVIVASKYVGDFIHNHFNKIP